MAQIRIPPVLRPEAGGQRLVAVEAGTVREALNSLVSEFPALKARVLEGDGVPGFLNVFVDGDDVRLLAGLDTAIAPTATILLLPAVAGGEEGAMTPQVAAPSPRAHDSATPLA
jgi:molybdopterin synthase sulfur carrier subunit